MADHEVQPAPATVRELEDAQEGTEAPADAGSEAAKQEIADCDASLRQHRASLEAGADPEIVTGWINETQAKRAAAEARLRQLSAGRRRMTREEITSMIKALGRAQRSRPSGCATSLDFRPALTGWAGLTRRLQ